MNSDDWILVTQTWCAQPHAEKHARAVTYIYMWLIGIAKAVMEKSDLP